MNPGSVFLSHSSKSPDFEFTRALAETLLGAGLDVWWDRDRLEGGDRFTAEIVEAISHQYVFVFVLSANSAASSWCGRELARAVELGKTVVPLKIDDIANKKIPLELAGSSYVDGRQGVEACFPVLARVLGLGLRDGYDPASDPFARDGRLIRAIAQHLSYGRTFTDSTNLVRLLSNIGTECCETKRARALFAGMVDRARFGGGRIDYDRVSQYLLDGWLGCPL